MPAAEMCSSPSHWASAPVADRPVEYRPLLCVLQKQPSRRSRFQKAVTAQRRERKGWQHFLPILISLAGCLVEGGFG
jgi:hypothetical protein